MIFVTFITLPDNIATSTLNISGGLISDLSPVWMMIVGVLVAVVVVTIIISALHPHK